MKTQLRYVVDCVSLPNRSWRWQQRSEIRVLDTQSGSSRWHWVRRGVVSRWTDLDRRYTGPRSGYGQALESARALAAELNAGIVADSRPLEIAA